MTSIQLCRNWWRWGLSLFFVVQCAGASAAASAGGQSGIFNTAYLVQTLGSMLLVFGCLLGLVFLLKKLNGVSGSEKNAIRVVGSLKVGSREKILLLETVENQLLVGVAAGNIRTLHVFDKTTEEPGCTSAKATHFSTLLASPEGRK